MNNIDNDSLKFRLIELLNYIHTLSVRVTRRVLYLSFILFLSIVFLPDLAQQFGINDLAIQIIKYSGCTIILLGLRIPVMVNTDSGFIVNT